jgi:hypothetical protein
VNGTTNSTPVTSRKYTRPGHGDVPIAIHYGLPHLSYRDAVSPDFANATFYKNWPMWFQGPHPDWATHQLVADVISRWWHETTVGVRCGLAGHLLTMATTRNTTAAIETKSFELPPPAFAKITVVEGCAERNPTTRYNPRLQIQFTRLGIAGELMNSFNASTIFARGGRSPIKAGYVASRETRVYARVGRSQVNSAMTDRPSRTSVVMQQASSPAPGRSGDAGLGPTSGTPLTPWWRCVHIVLSLALSTDLPITLDTHHGVFVRSDGRDEHDTGLPAAWTEYADRPGKPGMINNGTTTGAVLSIPVSFV